MIERLVFWTLATVLMAATVGQVVILLFVVGG